jgi:hypothetical protein
MMEVYVVVVRQDVPTLTWAEAHCAEMADGVSGTAMKQPGFSSGMNFSGTAAPCSTKPAAAFTRVRTSWFLAPETK